MQAQKARQDQAFQGLAPAQGHIGLAMGKGGAGVDDGFFKGKPLTFMDGNGPGQPEWVLPECTDTFFMYFLRLAVKRIFNVLPDDRFNTDLLLVLGTLDPNIVAADMGNGTNFAVEVALFRREIVAYEHHLSTHLQT